MACLSLCYHLIYLCTSKCNIEIIAIYNLLAERVGCTIFYVSQFTLETYCFADGRCLFKQTRSVIYHCNPYDEEISQSVGPSVHPSVCPPVCL